jgi:hypothetical protein
MIDYQSRRRLASSCMPEFLAHRLPCRHHLHPLYHFRRLHLFLDRRFQLFHLLNKKHNVVRASSNIIDRIILPSSSLSSLEFALFCPSFSWETAVLLLSSSLPLSLSELDETLRSGCAVGTSESSESLILNNFRTSVLIYSINFKN